LGRAFRRVAAGVCEEILCRGSCCVSGHGFSVGCCVAGHGFSHGATNPPNRIISPFQRACLFRFHPGHERPVTREPRGHAQAGFWKPVQTGWMPGAQAPGTMPEGMACYTTPPPP